jgi:hypothetical protein
MSNTKLNTFLTKYINNPQCSYNLFNDKIEVMHQLYNVQNEFIRNAYCLLLSHFSTITIFSFICMSNQNMFNWIQKDKALNGMFIFFLLLTYIYSFIANRTKTKFKIIFFIYTIFLSYIVAYISVCHNSITPSVSLINIIIFLSFIIAKTKWHKHKNNINLYNILWSSCISIVYCLISISFIHNNEKKSFVYGLLLSNFIIGFILFDTHHLMKELRVNEYIYLCTDIYLDVILLNISYIIKCIRYLKKCRSNTTDHTEQVFIRNNSNLDKIIKNKDYQEL